MAHSTTTVEEFPEPGSELVISVGAIAEKLLQTIRDKGDRTDSDQRGLLERALAVATEAEAFGRAEPAHCLVGNADADR